eukprot:768572-Hanusia_phi.AAC.7
MDTKRGARMITSDIRYLAFCKVRPTAFSPTRFPYDFCPQTINSDPSVGLSLEGLVGLYAQKDQQGATSPLLRGNLLLLASSLIICVIALSLSRPDRDRVYQLLLSVPYYLPSCTE